MPSLPQDMAHRVAVSGKPSVKRCWQGFIFRSKAVGRMKMLCYIPPDVNALGLPEVKKAALLRT